MTGYNDLVKVHIDPSKQKKKKKKTTNKNDHPPTDADAPRENSPEREIPSPAHDPVTGATTSPRPTEPIPMAASVRPMSPINSAPEEGELICAEISTPPLVAPIPSEPLVVEQQ